MTNPKRRVYFIQVGLRGLIKVGCSSNPRKRLISLQSAHFLPLRLVGVAKNRELWEVRVHHALKKYRVAGEWYYPENAVLQFISRAVRGDF